jgi:ankyrin repeat protein
MPKRDPLENAYEVLQKIDEEDGATHDPGDDLVLAAYFGDLDGARRALKRGASPDARQRKTKLPALWLAVSGGHAEVVKALVDAGADPLITVRAGKQTFTPLDRAELEGKHAIAELLRGTSTTAAARPPGATEKKQLRPEHNFALGQAVWDRQAARVDELLRDGADPNAKTSYGEPVLAYAQRSGSRDVVALLLAAGADANTRNDGRPLLHDALSLGDVETVEALLAAGADPNAMDKKHTTATALWSCDKKKRGRALASLLARGLDANSLVYDEPLLFKALREGLEELIAPLLAAGADPNVRLKYKQASYEMFYPINTTRKKKLLGMLLDNGLDVTNEACCGNPLTTRLVFDGQATLLDRVLTAGADPAAKSAGSTLSETNAFTKNKKVRAAIERVLDKHLAARAKPRKK